MFTALEDALEQMWGVKPVPEIIGDTWRAITETVQVIELSNNNLLFKKIIQMLLRDCPEKGAQKGTS